MKIACIGNTVYDCIVSDDKFLKEGERNSFYDAIFLTGGPASNAASVMAKYGDNVDIYTQIGNDENGKCVYKTMLMEKINLKHVSISDNMMTPLSFILINRSNNTRTISALRTKEDYFNPKIENIEYDSDYDYILTDGKYVNETINLIKNNPQAYSIIDAGRVNNGVLEICKHINCIICSEDFANGVTNMQINDDFSNNEKIFMKMKSLFENAKQIAITIGKRGYICENDGKVEIIPAYEPDMKTIDTNGAGDIFHGAFTHALANGYSYNKSLEFANITAALSTTKRGGRTSVPDLEVVENIFLEKGKVLTKKYK